jgi:hypothetical protein
MATVVEREMSPFELTHKEPTMSRVFIRGTLIIFVLHLVVVGLFGTLVATAYGTPHNEAPEAWIIFYAIDFPLIWLLMAFFSLFGDGLEGWIKLISSPFQQSRLNYYWDWVFLPGCYCQIVGWINWTIIWTLFLVLLRASRRKKHE